MLETNLTGAGLTKAHLTEAHLLEANLEGARLNLANFTDANLLGANLTDADLRQTNLSQAYLREANLTDADLRHANLTGADLTDADLKDAKLSYAELSYANLTGADLTGVDLTGANLNQANLSKTSMIGTIFNDASISSCRIYGISAWDLKGLDKAKQKDLKITLDNEPAITIDDLEVAQFIYLMLHNGKIRHIIDTITSKAVLILGRFTPERKVVLDAIREELRRRNYLPILFDFEKPTNRDLTETVLTLASMSRFVIADLTDPRSIPQELTTIVKELPSVPVQPILLVDNREYGMFEHFKQYPWVLETYYYSSESQLLNSIQDKIIRPAEDKVRKQNIIQACKTSL
jgi:hypothetical protein